jgi:hypothetical protein
MSAVIGRARVTILFEESFTIKDKRNELRSISKRVRNQFNAAIAEIEDLDDMRTGTLGIVVVSNAGPHASQMLSTVISFIERSLDLGILGDVHTELIGFDG